MAKNTRREAALSANGSLVGLLTVQNRRVLIPVAVPNVLEV
jgi:hypothetical protein